MTTTTTSIRSSATPVARVQGIVPVQGIVTGRSSFTGVVPVRTASPRTVTPRLLAPRDDAWSPPRYGAARAPDASGRKT